MICKNNDGKSSVEHYYLNGYLPEYLDPVNPSVGISNSRIMIDEGYMICSFTRDNFVSNVNNYYDTLNFEAYLLVAFGQMTQG